MADSSLISKHKPCTNLQLQRVELTGRITAAATALLSDESRSGVVDHASNPGTSDQAGTGNQGLSIEDFLEVEAGLDGASDHDREIEAALLQPNCNNSASGSVDGSSHLSSWSTSDCVESTATSSCYSYSNTESLSSAAASSDALSDSMASTSASSETATSTSVQTAAADDGIGDSTAGGHKVPEGDAPPPARSVLESEWWEAIRPFADSFYHGTDVTKLEWLLEVLESADDRKQSFSSIN